MSQLALISGRHISQTFPAGNRGIFTLLLPPPPPATRGCFLVPISAAATVVAPPVRHVSTSDFRPNAMGSRWSTGVTRGSIPGAQHPSCIAAGPGWSNPPGRPLFTNSYFKLDQVESQNNKQKLRVRSPGQFIEKVRSNFESGGVKNIFLEDIETALALSQTEADLRLSLSLIEGVLAADLRLVNMSQRVLHIIQRYFEQCHIHRLTGAAIAAWNSDTLRETRLLTQNSRIPELYFNLLFASDQQQAAAKLDSDKEQLAASLDSDKQLLAASLDSDNEQVVVHGGQRLTDQILSEFQQHKEILIRNRKIVMLVLLALYRDGSQEGLKRALQIMGDEHFPFSPGRRSDTSRTSRAVLAVALHAVECGELALAHDILRQFEANSYRSQSFLEASLRLVVLTESGRLQEAILYLRTAFLPRDTDREQNRKILYTAVSQLLQATSTDQQLHREMMEIVQVLDQTAQVESSSLRDLMLAAIDVGGGGPRPGGRPPAGGGARSSRGGAPRTGAANHETLR